MSGVAPHWASENDQVACTTTPACRMLLFGFAQVPTTALHGFPAAVQAAAPPHPVPAAEQRGVVQQLVDAHHPGARLGGGALVVGRTLRACKGASWNTNGRTSCHPNMLPQEVDPHYQRTVMVCSKFDNRLKAGPGASPGGGHSRAAAFMAVVLLAGVLLTLLLQCHSVLCLPRAAAGVQRAVGGGQVPERQRLPAPLRQALLRGWVTAGYSRSGVLCTSCCVTAGFFRNCCCHGAPAPAAALPKDRAGGSGTTSSAEWRKAIQVGAPGKCIARGQGIRPLMRPKALHISGGGSRVSVFPLLLSAVAGGGLQREDAPARVDRGRL